jgi:Holliday junction DNA helicase RuvB
MIEENKIKENYKNLSQKLDINVLRPKKLDDFIGQESIKKQLKIFIEAAKRREKPLDHILLYGPAGLGKTTLSIIVANEMSSNIKIVSAQVFEKNGDLVALLSSVKDNDIVFIDEIHRLKINLEEVLFPAMEDFKLDVLIGKGVSSQTVRLNLPHFTLIGATTQVGNISKPLQTRFGIILKMDYYDDNSLQKIILRASKLLQIDIDDDSALEIAKRSRGTPRIAIRLLKRVHDFSIFLKKNLITVDVVNKSLEEIGIDKDGLDLMDRRILTTILNDYNGGPVGLSTLSISISEDKRTLEEFYEPFLIQKGFIRRTSKGRMITEKGMEYLKNNGLILGNKDKTLF